MTRKHGIQIIFGGFAVILFGLYAESFNPVIPYFTRWELFLLSVSDKHLGIFVGAAIVLFGAYIVVTRKSGGTE